MANDVRLVMKPDALYRLRRERGVRADCERRAAAVLRVCGQQNGYMMASTQGKKAPQGRWRATVFTSNVTAMLDNRKHNTLVRAFGAARG